MKNIHTLLSLITLGIGLYMAIMFAGKALPPLLSGLAFTAIGIKQLLFLKS